MMTRDINRRTMLALAATGVLGSRINAAQSQLRKLRNGESTPLQFFTADDYQVIETLTEMIIPADDHSAGAREARVASYIDLVVGNSGDDTKTTWREGLNAFDAAVQRHVGASFLSAAPDLRADAINQILKTVNNADASARAFFMQVKEMTVFGYYSSEIGLLKELEYKGNQAMAMFPGCEQ